VEGGLAIALQAALKDRGGVWFGWSGDTVFHESGQAQVTKIGRVSYATLDLAQRDYDEYYSGFANSVLWPLFHNRLDLTDFSRRDRAGYQRVNAMFARRLLPLLEARDVIWVHDYHFIPLGEYLRQAGCRQRLGFFLHIPWPPMELLLTLPDHEALVRELCAYDLIGFQTRTDLNAFEQYIREEAGGTVLPGGRIRVFGRSTVAKSFPISIETAAVAELARKAENSHQTQRLSESLSGRQLITSVDRLDYTKGLIERMEAYQHLLASYPAYRDNVSLLQIAVPSRTNLPDYQQMRRQVESLAGHINGTFAKFDWSPVRYLNRAYKRQTLMGFLRLSNVGLSLPLRDGMNLVAKEFVAAQSPKDPGVLVLSRFAGAAHELDGALIVNPYDIEGVGDSLARALSMSCSERRERWQTMFAHLSRFNLQTWRDSFLNALETAPCSAAAA
jgi:trehalose 6-phosphate synthase